MVTAMEFTLEYFMRIEAYYRYPHLLGILNVFPFLHAGLLFGYISLVTEGIFTNGQKVMVAIPFIIGLFLSWSFLILDGKTKLSTYLEGASIPIQYQVVVVLFYAISVGLFLWWGALKLWKFHKKWKLDIYDPGKNGVIWLKWLVAGLCNDLDHRDNGQSGNSCVSNTS